MKKSTQISKRTILFLSFLFSFTLAFSQPGTNVQKLQELANKFKTKWENQKTNAKAYSVRNNIPLRKVLNNGKIIELINVENDKPFYYTTNNINAAITTRTNELWTGGSLGLTLDGSSYNGLGIWDGGAVLTTHREFNNTGIARVIQSDGATSVSDHATHVSGTMIAGGVSTNAKGMAFNANLKAYDWTNDDAEMATAASNGLQISNHSYSYIHGWDDEGVWHGTPSVSTEEDYYFGFYSGYTSNWDEIAYNAPYYLIVKSAGNDRNDSGDGTYPPDGGTTGYDCIGTTGIAKNILTVGAVYDVLDYTGTAAVDMSSFSSWGPADDGRIKPDIVANGVGLYSSLGSATNSYGSYSGTSMSSPNAAGTLALLQQHYQNTHDGASMRAATLKALVIHTADEAGTSPGPDYKFGWGLINAEKAAELITADGNGKYNMDEQVLNNGETFSVDIQSAGTEPLVVSVVWTDPEHAALPAALDPPTPHLVNDLDLRLLNGGSTFYPYKLDVNNPSAPATNNTENNVDNVELVNISNPVAGTYTIQVDHDGTLAQPQQFSLVISGGEQITNEQITYAIIGDFGSGNSNETDVANLVKSWNPDFVVTTGDDRYGSTTFDLTIGRDYCEFLAGAGSGTYCSGNESPVNSFFPSTGNHEYTDGGGITEYLEYFDLPGDGVQSSGTSGSEKYYDFIQGPIHFFVIDSYDATTNGTLTTQQNWLQAQMTASNSIWKVIVFHHPPYSSSSNHGSTTAMRWPFAEWGADAVLNGHDHTYERLNAEGITYMVNGLGGMSKYDFGTPLPESIIQYSAEYGAQKVVADNNTMTFSFININNEIIDEVTLYKTNPPENNAPVFTSNPIVGKPEAEVGTNYSSSIDGDATDADNDQLIFSKVSGANWLNIASNGTLSGTPQNSDIGLNLIIVKVSDGKGGIAEAELQIIVNPAPAPPPSGTVEVRISNANDDVEEKISDGYMYFESTDIELGDDLAHNGEQTEGLLFRNIYVPQGTSISSAYIEFETDEISTSATVVEIKAQNIDQAPDFTNVNYNLSSREKTTATVSWDIPAWNTVNEKHQSPDISSVIQEIVNRAGWTHNNNIAIIIEGTGTRTAESYDGEAAAAALLHIEYSEISNTPPTFTSNPIIESDATEDAVYSGSVADNATDLDGDDLSFSKISGPNWLTVATNGNLSGTPLNEDVGLNTWTIQVNDGKGGTAQATLQIGVINTNDFPVFSSDPIIEINAFEDADYSSSVNDDATDPDNDNLTFTKTFGPEWLIVSLEGNLSGNPANSDVGLNIFTLVVEDGNGGTDQAELQITVVNINNPPEFIADPVSKTAASEDELYSATISTDATDADGDNLTFSKVSGPNWLTVATNGNLSGTPLNEDVGLNTWTIQVNDGNGGTAQAALQIVVFNTNDAPVFNSNPIIKSDAFAGTLYNNTLFGEASDEDGDVLQYSISGPNWLTVNTDGSISGTPDKIDAGLNSWIVEVNDGNNGTDEATLEITVIDPTIVIYCPSNGNATNEWIENVTFNGQNNNSGSSGTTGYEDFTELQPFTIDAGSSANITLEPGFSPRSKFEYWSVWIDFNRNGDFNDLGEQVFTANKSKSTVSGIISIPNISSIETTMRISMKRGSLPSSCESLFLGEVEDYSITINGTEPQAPVADFAASNTTIEIGESIQFTDLSLNAPTEWLWTFQGGTPSISTDQNPNITFNEIGVFDVSLTATNGIGSDTDSRTGFITVTAPQPQPPVANFTSNKTNILLGESVQFSDISTNNPTVRLWTFSGGTPSTSTDLNPEITYNSLGSFTVSLYVENSDGNDSKTATEYITVSAIPEDYCTTAGLDNSLEWIQSVTIAGIFNNSGKSTLGYSDFSGQRINLVPGSTVNISLIPGFVNKSQREFWRIWIDFNNDYDFLDAGEEVFAANNTKADVSGSFNVPSSVISNETRMRISMKQGSAPIACGDFSRGEVEDYTVTFNTSNFKSANIQAAKYIKPESSNEVKFKVYPNPVSDKLNIQFEGWEGKKEIRLFDMTGKTVFLKSSSEKYFEIDVASFPTGIYLLDVNNGNYRENKKISIQ